MQTNFSAHAHSYRSQPAQQAGFTLLEVLISLLVLAIGLLGLAALQNMGLRLNTQSYERTQATILIDDMIDRMRANAAGVRAGDYNALVPAPTNVPPVAAQDCEATVCTSTSAVAVYDVNRWIATIAGTNNAGAQIAGAQTGRALSGGTGSITPVAGGVAGGGLLFNITVGWQEQNLLPNQQTVTVQLP